LRLNIFARDKRIELKIKRRMKRYLRNPQLLIPALIFIVLLTIPLTRRYTALQMGWQSRA